MATSCIKDVVPFTWRVESTMMILMNSFGLSYCFMHFLIVLNLKYAYALA